MASNIEILINAVNRASGPLGEVGASMDGLSGKASSLVSGGLGPLQSMLGVGIKAAAGLAVGGIVALGAGLTSSIGAAADMEQGVADLSANMGASAEETVKLKDLISNLGLDPKLKVTATEAAAAIGQLGTAGTSVTDILGGAARNTVLLANATGADFTSAASIASDVMHLWGISANDLGEAVNGITAATVASKFNINDYRLALAQAGGVAATVGVSFDDFNATIAAISPSFASGSDAGTSFKTFLQRLIPQSNDARDAMRDLGLFTGATKEEFQDAQAKIQKYQARLAELDPTSKNYAKTSADLNSKIAALRGVTNDGSNAFFDANGNMKDMAEIVGILNKAFVGLTEEQKNEKLSTIFGTDAMRAAAAMAGMTEEQFRALKTTMGKTDAEAQAAQRMNTFKGAMEILGGVIDTVKMQIGDKFLPILTQMAKQFTDMLTGFAPRIVEWAGTFAAKVGELAQVWLPVLVTKLGEWWNIGAQLVAQIPTLYNNFINFVNQVRTAIAPVIDFVSRFVSLKDILIGVAAVFAGAAVASLATFVAAAAPVIVVVTSAIAIVTALRDAWSRDFGGIQEKTTAVLNYLYDRFHLLGDFIATFGKGALSEIANWVLGNQTEFTNLGHIWDQIRQTARVLFSDLVGVIQANLPIWLARLGEWGAAAWGWLSDAMPVALTKIGEFVTGLYAWLSTNLPVWIAKLAPFGLALFQWIGDNIPKAIDELTRWIDGLLGWGSTTGTTKTQELMTKLGAAMLNALGRIGISLAGLALTVAGDLLLSFAKGILDWAGINVNWQAMHDHLIGLIGQLTSSLSGAVALIGGVVLAALLPGFSGIMSALGGLVSTILGPVIGALGALLAPFAPIIAIVAVVSAAVYGLYLAWQNNLFGIRDRTREAFDFVRSIFTDFPATIDHLKETFFSWSNGAMGRLREGFIGAQDSVRNGLDVVMDFIQQGRDARLGPFQQSLFDAGAAAISKMGQGFGAARQFAVDNFNQVMTDVQSQGLAFAGGALLGRMYEGGRNFILKVGEGIRAASPNMAGDLNAAFSGLVTTFNYWHDNLVPHFLGSAKDLASKIGAGFAGVNLGGAIDGAFIGLRDAFNRWHDDLLPHFFSAMKGIGDNVIGGLVNGIRAGIGAVLSAIQGVTDALPQWVKDKLGIASPSTVFEGFGRNVIEGFVNGIKSMADAPQLALDGVAANMQASLGNMQLGAGGNTNTTSTDNSRTNNFNVTVPTAGGDRPSDQMQSLFNTLSAVYSG